MRDLVAEHDARFRAAIEANDGYVVKSERRRRSHAAFGRAGDAVAAAEQAPGRHRGPARHQGADGHQHGRGARARRRLLRPAGEPRRAARWPRATVARCCSPAVTAELVPGLTLRNLGEHRLRDLGSPMLDLAARHRRVPAAAHARRAAGQPAGAAHELHRPGRRGEGARRARHARAVGDADRAGRGRQVAPRVAGRGRGRARVQRRRVVRVARRARRGRAGRGDDPRSVGRARTPGRARARDVVRVGEHPRGAWW